MNFNYIILVLALFLFSCQNEEDNLPVENCAECSEYEENLMAIRYFTDPISLDWIPYDTVPIIATLDSGIYCIGDPAFQVDVDAVGLITVGNDTLSPNGFLDIVDEDLLELMTQNASCEFLTGSN